MIPNPIFAPDFSTVVTSDDDLSHLASILVALIHAAFSPVQFRDEADESGAQPESNKPKSSPSPNFPDLLSGSSARALNRLNKAAALWCAMIAEGHTPNAAHIKSLLPSNQQDLFYADLLDLPQDPARLTSWLLILRKSMTTRALRHLATYNQLASTHGRTMSDADLRVVSLIEQLNPLPNLSRHRRSAAVSRVINDQPIRSPQTANPAPILAIPALDLPATAKEIDDLLGQLLDTIPGQSPASSPQTAKLPRPSKPGKQVKLRPKHAMQHQ